MIDWALLILVLVAIAIGFALGRRSSYLPEDADEPSLQPHYIQGLNYLLNEQPDAAIDSFIDNLAVNSETLETHLALGNLLRKRGEVGRAIKIHQNLLARPGLGAEQSRQVQLELSRDFIKSGLLDRAEMLLKELVATATPAERVLCIEYLIEIYREEKEWQAGIEMINKLPSRRFSRLPDEWRAVQSHFYCELAEEALKRSDYLTARRHIREASLAHKQSARASLLQADLDYRLGQYKEAIKVLKHVYYQDSALLPEALPLLTTCHRALGSIPQLRHYLNELLEYRASIPVVLALTELIVREEGAETAAAFLSTHAAHSPSLKVAEMMLSLQLASYDSPPEGMVMADKIVRRLQKAAPQYRCNSCGFAGQKMHWLCPSCKTWGSIKPVE
jgi:lipopolysaccharide biosynthesis regulator YciM